MEPPLLQMQSVHKRFGRTHALKGVDFEIRAGEAHALLGENGSGKSTLMKIAYGEVTASSGHVLLRGEPVKFANPLQASRAGIAMVAQEVPVVESLTVAENIALGNLPGSRFRIDWTKAHRSATEALGELGSGIRSDRIVGTLGPGDRQVVAIARAIASKSSVVIFDEPTSSLTAELTESLFDIIRKMKSFGLAIAFISQRLQDIEPVADRVTVLRDGALVKTMDLAEADEGTITRLMVGRPLTDYFHREIAKTRFPSDKPALSVRHLSAPDRVEDVGFDIWPGEVVGLAGLVGCGRVEVVRSIFGADAGTGDVTVEGKAYTRRTPRRSIQRDLAFVTGDRKGEGLVPGASVFHNLSLIANNRLNLLPINRGSQRVAASSAMQELQVRPADMSLLAGSLSGGNQQKVVIGRWLSSAPKVLLMDEPTRGVDVGAKSEIYRLLRELASQGVAVLISSSENNELLGVCDRVLVMFRGRIVADRPSDQLDELTIAELAAGVINV
ncbi:sugar ABC transporter ATP-binding protein [Rhodococcus sp. Leaf233]|uniref:sugar ABC transporter ATP-binding protein n=1 Tax=Rhodococcus sp. Leaf233 TaxID=1736302 RepID=UPI000AA977C4|nr:sugar ABC transporter ATP-binding protein [Rhodococcus sp. Leaf233]